MVRTGAITMGSKVAVHSGQNASNTKHALSSALHTTHSVSAFSLFFQAAIGLAVVLFLIWLLARILSGRLGTGKGLPLRRAGMRVVARQNLGRGTSLALVQVGEKYYVVGASPGGVHRVATLDEQEIFGEDPLPGTPSRGPGAFPPWVTKVPWLARSIENRWPGALGSKRFPGTTSETEVAVPPSKALAASSNKKRPGARKPRPSSPAVLERTGDDATWTSAIAVLKERTRGA